MSPSDAALGDVTAAQKALHASSYWKPASKGWAKTQLAQCDAALVRAIAGLQPAPPPALDPAGQWYSADSPWNTDIPPGAPLHPQNATMSLGFRYVAGLTSAAETARVRADGSSVNPFAGASHIVNLAYNGVPSVGVATAATPLVQVRVNYPPGGELQLPIPAGMAVQANGMENSATILLPDGTAIDLFKLTAPGSRLLLSDKWLWLDPDPAKWTAVIAAPVRWDDKGYGVATSRESYTPAGSGMIRSRDFDTPVGGHWDHALAWVGGPIAASNMPPFSHGIGDNNAGTMRPECCIPYGARIQLDPAFNVDALGLAEWKKQYLRTLQIHGAVPVDSNSSVPGTGWTTVLQWPYTLFTGRLGFGDGTDDNIPAAVAASLRVLA